MASTFIGDEILNRRPMERVAAPLRAMGARVRTTEGHPPLEVAGGPLTAIRFAPPVPSAQVKGCVLLAGLDAEGETMVVETARTRDHTERALEALGAPVSVEGTSVTVRRFQHGGFEATVPGDFSSALFLVAAAALSGSPLVVRDIGLNPSRTTALEILRRMGIETTASVERTELGEPIGTLEVHARTGAIGGTTVSEQELPLVIDEVPVLAILAGHARGESRFLGAAELRLKESDRLAAISSTVRGLGGHAAVEGDDLVVAGGGYDGGSVSSGGDHRLAMAAAVAAVAARGSVTVEGMEAAEVSFPGFVEALDGLGVRAERA
jgi:3-phosphoshikimate 1-carboxyvinyltransferase